MLERLIKYSMAGGLVYIVLLIEMETLRGILMDTEVWYAFLACFVLICFVLDMGDSENETVELEVK